MDTNATLADVAYDAADRFNRLAAEKHWPLLCDPYCRFTDHKLHDALQLWLAKGGGGIPYRKDMTARLLQPYISQLSIFERLTGPEGDRRWRVRLMGTEVALTTAEMTGKFVDEVIPECYLERWLQTGETILASGRPVRLLRRADSFGKQHIVSEEFTAPLRNDSGAVEMTIGISSFENFDPWDVVEKRTRRELGLD